MKKFIIAGVVIIIAIAGYMFMGKSGDKMMDDKMMMEGKDMMQDGMEKMEDGMDSMKDSMKDAGKMMDDTMQKGDEMMNDEKKMMDDKMMDDGMHKGDTMMDDTTYIMTDDKMSLYIFTKDKPNKSNCVGECLAKWPAYFSEEMSKKAGFGMIVRADGTKQLTYKSMPLYTFFKDKKEGDRYGDGVKGVWFLAKMEK